MKISPAKQAPPRPVVEDVRPRVDDGRFDAKATVGAPVDVYADAFVDGHDQLRVDVLYRREGDRAWQQVRMAPIGDDRWHGAFTPDHVGRYLFQVRARVDGFATWLRDLRARAAAGQDISGELEVGARLAEQAADRASGAHSKQLLALASDVRTAAIAAEGDAEFEELGSLVARYSPDPATLSPAYGLWVDRERARFSTWYELFPRSAAAQPGRHGTFLDVIDRLDYVRSLGADVLYLPPIHPIGVTNRKGRDGAVTAEAGDVGSPWAIGSAAGGHTSIHPDLGTLEEFAKLVGAARDAGIEIALDIAFQCSPDHPWVSEHPEWFRHRPDGTIRYAENPPKKYEDIYPLDFDTSHWRELWEALHGVVEFWIEQGISIFRVDNPHTKAFPFWEWLIPTVHETHPEVLFLAEAFTRPKVMKRLAKLGFSQSYTYFAWRTAKWELEHYLTELTRTDMADYFRPNFWPNTPDILTEQLQRGDRRTFAMRAVLAATLAANYGIYGPSFELAERQPRHEGSEEYLAGEKYELRSYDLDAATSLAPLLAELNRIRREQLALQHDRTLRFHHTDSDAIIAYSKTLPAGLGGDYSVSSAPILVIVNLDDRYRQSAWVDLDLGALGVAEGSSYDVHDLLTGSRYTWTGPRSFVILDPNVTPAHVFRIEPAIAPAPAEQVRS
ncbi:MAG TPA: alpha-1,4-glucan--maltose-1-phosphate maltosyltransferase [Mycobacteriales bacterium]|nr:alpha-1,4-glucan--maltose-1-phosphate maltosyltransferase [Mycobacteriales bacterium]HWA68012.1 alpha-1,4-glucan--maltose-1-phosphate maltosyltransferase [Mycobacteriales bacterium]